jgi:hypothetical protein
MATTQNSYTGDGTTVLYSFTFPYLDQSHVKVTLNEVVTTAYTFANATQIQFTSAPGSGVRIRIYRETDVDTAEATFFAGSSVRHDDLNDNQLQSLYSAQEQENNKWGKNTDTLISTETWSSADDKIATTASIQSQIATQVAGIINADVVAGNAITVSQNTPTAGKVTVAVTNNSIDTAELVDASVTTAKIADNNVTSDKILDANVTTAKIADANVTEAKLATDSVTSDKIAAGAVDTSELATDAVTSVKIADANVTTAKIANSAVNSDKLANDSVIATKILDNTITTAKLTDATVVTDAEQATVVTNDTSFFTTTAADSRFVNTTGDTMSGALDMGTNKITNLDTPTATTDAATKAYVDGVVASGSIADADYGDITVTGSGTTWTIDNDTITSAKIVDGTIVDGDINASAAIAGTKVSPDFGSQDVQTSGLIKSANGTAANPSITFTSDTDTGVYRNASDQVGITTGGVRRAFVDFSGLTVDASGVTVNDTAPSLNLDGIGDAGLSTVNLKDNAGNGSSLVMYHTNYVGGTELSVGGDGTILNGQANIGINAGASSEIRFGINNVEAVTVTSSGQLDLNTNKIINAADPTGAQDAATKNYVDTTTTANPIYVAVAGDTMSGALAMGTNKITGVGDPTAAQDAATKNYVDTTTTANPLYVAVAGDDMTGDLTLSNQSDLRFGEATANGSNWVAFQAPSAVAANVTWTLPNADATVSGHALKSDGAGNLSWGTAGGAAGGGTDQVFYENDQTVNTSYSITSNRNAMSAGPITIGASATVTIPAGSTWTIV